MLPKGHSGKRDRGLLPRPKNSLKNDVYTTVITQPLLQNCKTALLQQISNNIFYAVMRPPPTMSIAPTITPSLYYIQLHQPGAEPFPKQISPFDAKDLARHPLFRTNPRCQRPSKVVTNLRITQR